MPGLGNPSHNQQPSLVSITLTLTTVKVALTNYICIVFRHCFSDISYCLSLSLFFIRIYLLFSI